MVEELLTENDRLRGFLSQPPFAPRGNASDGAATQGLAKGARLGRYSMVEALGSGGMGEVYRATDANLHRDVAVKVLRSQTGGRSRPGGAIRAGSSGPGGAEPPNICTIYEICDEEGLVFIAMELLEGANLRQRMAGKPLEFETAHRAIHSDRRRSRCRAQQGHCASRYQAGEYLCHDPRAREGS